MGESGRDALCRKHRSGGLHRLMTAGNCCLYGGVDGNFGRKFFSILLSQN